MPRDTLTKDQIVGTAIELLDAEGLEGLNMRALGQRLDSAATAVYWHVKSKDNLLRLASDQVWNEIALPDVEAVGWREAAAVMATSLLAMFKRHPWVVQAIASQVSYGPGKARHDDHSLWVYEAAGFSGAEADQASAATFMYVLGNAVGESANAALSRKLTRAGNDAEKSLGETMAKAREVAMEFPRLRERLDGPAAEEYGAAPEDSFELGLRAMLDGLANRLYSHERRLGG
ncbi:TetR/AcrR family transcriptional regulator C-terminal domain-containing protein [Actinomadura barringtoniae]|uniref:TetR/AcrR family transcriptional regulator C-terminal domain-containing protein n=1 Tax=Actinomadura barringtoniae TaxID=1427535 RepID=A0A939T833_9ACTN|nr:TetR/AcrR family transcriptional regulator C-terminal domain-containing protein [Actinomadura barringtoniae]MBO2446470.1 TetR/AcrR family transcriptional regulator C-terminal domain-containing protein [Actinomadura barringtoniae]